MKVSKMARPKKTIYNPHQLTAKQDLTIKGIVEDVANGKGFQNVANHKKFYNTKNDNVTQAMASQNLGKLNFREALLTGLKKRNIIGVNGKVSQRLAEGLDAKSLKSDPDPLGEKKVRLEYIKEVNKVIGAYAPLKIDQRSLTAQIKPEDLDKGINSLQDELKAE